MPGEEIRGFRDEAQRAAQRAVAAGLGTLGHDDVGPDVQRVLHVLHILALADQLRAGAADLAGERAGIAKGQHDGGGTMFQRVGQERRRLAQRPGDEPDADARAAGRSELFLDPGRVAVAAADQAQAAGAADGRRQRAAAGERHRRGYDRMPQVQAAGESVGKRHHG